MTGELSGEFCDGMIAGNGRISGEFRGKVREGKATGAGASGTEIGDLLTGSFS